MNAIKEISIFVIFYFSVRDSICEVQTNMCL